ncbi:valine--tRNA ligase [Candidatus Woesearchaeota archaeon]|nr:valine--tRNA ligase [Candidatus Woesearchaeota archaeon]
MDLPKDYNFKEAERKWQQYWENEGIYLFDPKSKAEIYSCDTPPPTVSGRMHMGHALGYSQADFIMRFHRMLGKNIFYPWGFDDNGLATERFVEKKLKIRGQDMPRPEFVKLCLKETKETEEKLKQHWQSLGISPDWTINYKTIDPWVQKTSQRSFLELYKRGREYRKKQAFMWCPRCQTAIAQVELKDKEKEQDLTHIQFDTSIGEKITFATTRPEFLPACVLINVHPNDKKNSKFIGAKARIPFFDREVEITADESVDPEFGTGVVYVCSFGDMEDAMKIEELKIEPVEILNKNGTLNEKAGKYKGMTTLEARKAIVDDLDAEGRVVKVEKTKSFINTHERCDTEVEILMTEQWFIKYLDLKEKFLELGEQLNWHPKHMKVRYDNWVKGLKWDWCISRQRFFGIPFPLWYCKKCGEINLADEKDLPVDPTVDKPKKKCKCGSDEFIPEKDVLDTWATSSLTPLIPIKWREDEDFFKKIFPYSLRANGHDIITFWLFNTVVKSWLHEQKLPWKDVMINGFVLDPHGKKMSKSKGNVIDPLVEMEKYGADSLRFWAAGSRLGDDLPYQEKDLVTGKKMVTKLWNASKFAIKHLEDYSGEEAQPEIMDKWILSKMQKLIKNSTTSLDEYEFFTTKSETEKFFWHIFCDNYLEIVKDRLYNPEKRGKEKRVAAQFTLCKTLLALLKLVAPIMPHITEEIYQLYFRENEDAKSIHISGWPKYDESFVDNDVEYIGDIAVGIIAAVRKFKSEKNVSLKTELKSLTVECSEQDMLKLEEIKDDLLATTKALELKFGKGDITVNDKMKIGIE